MEECTVACWDGNTSRPGDAETRALRQRCHAAFDPLWRPGPGKMFAKRNQAYKWLGSFMELPKDLCHIGMFSADQCRKLLALLEKGA